MQQGEPGAINPSAWGNVMTDLAIVGGGAAGAAVFGELLRRSGSGSRLHWITDGASPGRGIAYASQDDGHLLNVRAAGMGLFAEQKDDFLQFARGSLGCVDASDFVPRHLFGRFIEAQLQGRMSEARARGVRFHLHQDRAVAVHRATHGGYRVALASGEEISVAGVVLAIGALPPRPLRCVSEQALHSGAYVLDPWRQEDSSTSPRRVVVIGTGLTAVDALVSASTRWPHAELVAVSRHGLLPFRHTASPLPPYPAQAALNASLLACQGVAAMLRRVREALADPACTDWRAVIDGMRPINAMLWQGLTIAQRRQFLRHLRWLWESARHRSAPASFDTVQELIKSGRLRIHAARVLAVDGRDPLTITVRHRANQHADTVLADRIIQATGLDTSVAYARDSLLAQLLRDGLAAPDPLHLGVAATPEGQLLDAEGNALPQLWGIGALLRGNLWECTAMPEIRVAASTLARLLSDVEQRSRPEAHAGH